MKTSILVASLGMLLLAGTPAAPTGGAVVLKPDDLKAMSLDAMLAAGESYVKEMNELVRSVLNELGSARESKDFQRMNCLGDVLTTLKGLLRLSEQNAITLREQVIAKNRTGAEHEFVKLSIARNKVVELHAQAKGCGSGGTETMFEGTPQVEKLFDKDLPLEEARTGLDNPIVVVEPPPSASPFY